MGWTLSVISGQSLMMYSHSDETAGQGNTVSLRTDGGSGRPAGSSQLSLDAILGALSNVYRRDVLYFLVDSTDPVVPAEEVMDELVTRETERTGERPNRDNIELELLHFHLPKLADLGLVDYDNRHKDIHYHSNPRLEEWLNRVRVEERGDHATESTE